MNPEDIKVGKLYRGNRRRKLISGEYDDRIVLHVSGDGLGNSHVQYDSNAIRIGRHYPTVSMYRFLKWCHSEMEDKK